MSKKIINQVYGKIGIKILSITEITQNWNYLKFDSKKNSSFSLHSVKKIQLIKQKYVSSTI